jgi:hypothetical protein
MLLIYYLWYMTIYPSAPDYVSHSNNFFAINTLSSDRHLNVKQLIFPVETEMVEPLQQCVIRLFANTRFFFNSPPVGGSVFSKQDAFLLILKCSDSLSVFSRVHRSNIIRKLFNYYIPRTFGIKMSQ